MIPPLYSRAGTSYEAAESIEGKRLTLREQVYRFIEASGGATDIEIADALGLAENTARPRRYELEREGRIVDSGQRRQTPSKRAAIVWMIPTGQLAMLRDTKGGGS